MNHFTSQFKWAVLTTCLLTTLAIFGFEAWYPYQLEDKKPENKRSFLVEEVHKTQLLPRGEDFKEFLIPTEYYFANNVSRKILFPEDSMAKSSPEKMVPKTIFTILQKSSLILIILLSIIIAGYTFIFYVYIAPLSYVLNFFKRAQSFSKINLSQLEGRWNSDIRMIASQLKKGEVRLERMEATLSKTRGQLLAQEKLANLGVLTASIVHEVKNPLHYIINFADVSLEHLEDLKSHLSSDHALISTIIRNTQKAKEHAKRADNIIKRMLGYVRRDKLSLESVQINHLVDEALELAYEGYLLSEKSLQIKIIKHYENNLPEVSVSKQELIQAFFNIITNACFAMKEKAERVKIDYAPELVIETRRYKDKIKITIQDNGIGISASLKKKIFEPFFTTKQPDKGTGLGLSICSDIISQHGGLLEVDSKSSKNNKYTKFIITINL